MYEFTLLCLLSMQRTREEQVKNRDDDDIGDIIEKTGPLSRLMITVIAVAVIGIIIVGIWLLLR
jgi:hypothetical protein